MKLYQACVEAPSGYRDICETGRDGSRPSTPIVFSSVPAKLANQIVEELNEGRIQEKDIGRVVSERRGVL